MPSTETEIALLKKRMDDVETFVADAPDIYVTKEEVREIIAASMPSREDIKNDLKTVLSETLVEKGSEDKKDKRKWLLEVIKAVSYIIFTSGMITLYQLITGAFKAVTP